MGYYTSYSLDIQDADPGVLAKIHDFLRKNENAYYGLDIGDQPSFKYKPSQDVKWYEHEKDMVALSANFPGVLFCLEGSGEEQGDQWRLYCRGGKAKHIYPEIKFAKFEDNMLPNPNVCDYCHGNSLYEGSVNGPMEIRCPKCGTKCE